MRQLQSDLINLLLDNGATQVGFAKLEGSEYHCGVSILVEINRDIVIRNFDGPTPEYYNEFLRLMDLLEKLGQRATEYLKYNGHEAILLGPTGDLDLETLTTPIPHKLIATKAGLGWIGKNGLLVTSEYGPAVMMVSVLTNADFETGKPVIDSCCGECSSCVDVCPPRALKNTLWSAGMERMNILDVHICEKDADERGVQIGVDPNYTVCGQCITACPYVKN